MRLSIYLDSGTEIALAEFAAQNGVSKSEAVRRGLHLLLPVTPAPKSAYELGKHLFGRHASGRTDGSVNVKKYVREAIRAKHAKARAPGNGLP